MLPNTMPEAISTTGPVTELLPTTGGVRSMRERRALQTLGAYNEATHAQPTWRTC